jgi:hypothetical protein
MRKQYSLGCLGIASVLFAVLAVGIAWKGAHLWWWVTHRDERSGVPAVSMFAPSADELAQLSYRHFGSLEFGIIPGLGSDVRPAARLGGVVFSDGERTLAVSLPKDHYRTWRTQVDVIAALPKRFRTSPKRLEALAYQTGTAQFRWHMTREELSFYGWLLGYKQLVCAQGVTAVETLYRDDMEGLLLVFPNSASFEWVSYDGRASGVLLFTDRAQTRDMSWIHRSCVTLRYGGGTYPEDIAELEIERLVRGITIIERPK